VDANQIPRRTYLDTSILQTLYTFGEFVYENVAVAQNHSLRRNPMGMINLDALRFIMQVNARAQLQFVVSPGALHEVAQRNNLGYLRYALDIQAYSDDLIEETGAAPAPGLSALLDHKSVGFLGEGDRQLLKEAISLGCDGFMTMENKLPRNSQFIRRLVGLLVLSPADYWVRLKPYAALYY
jgi:hypothetical protein